MSDGFAITSDDWHELDRITVTHLEGPVFTVVRERNLDVIDTRAPYLQFAEAFRVRVEPRVPGLPHPQVFTGTDSDGRSMQYYWFCQFEAITMPAPVTC